MRSPSLGHRQGAVRWLLFRRLGKTVHVRKASFHNARSTSMPPLQLQLCLQSMPDTKDYGNPFRAVALLMSRSRCGGLQATAGGVRIWGKTIRRCPSFRMSGPMCSLRRG